MFKRFVFLLFFTTSSLVFSKNALHLKHYVRITNHSASYNIKKAEFDIKKQEFKRIIKKNTPKYQTNKKRTPLLLSIKLDSIKKLHQEKLLRKDVLKNTTYYTNFLKDLKSSSITSDQYIFLENELLKISIVKANKKFRFTSYISALLILIIGLLIVYILKNIKRKTLTVTDLTKQEITIKKLIIDGKTNKEIANELHISLNTVKTHISNIYQKLNISNRRDLIISFKK